MFKFIRAILIIFLGANLSHAYDSHIIYNKDKAIFKLDFYDKAEITTFWNREKISSYTLENQFKNELIRAAQFWANIIGDNAQNTNAIPISISTMDDKNANAISYDVYENPIFNKILQGENIEHIKEDLLNGGLTKDSIKYLGHINMGKLDWYAAKHPSTLPENGNKSETFSTFTHELFHALGLSASTIRKNTYTYFHTLNSFSKHLYDAKNTKAQENIQIAKTQEMANEIEKQGNKAFLVDKNALNQTDSLSNANGHAYFKGKNVLEVIKNAELGYDGINAIPISGWEGDDLDMSHIELDNSLMSHQIWTNFLFYMEAELALLQDLGYQFDRKLYYGDSIYENNLQYQSDHGYYARKNNQWIKQEYNPTEYGIGLHVYGKNNKILQEHDILSKGNAATGIRIDGSNNKLDIGQGVKIYALGDHSNALLISYGKEHDINTQGELKATGQEGIAIHINFGDNEQIGGNDFAYRGSYMLEGDYYKFQDPEDIKDMINFYNLDGALVKNLNLSSNSSTIGNLAAIYIADNAYVEKINIEKGALIQGDIISQWKVNNTKLLDLYKGKFIELNFNENNSNPQSKTISLSSLPNFSINGNILGYDSLKMNVNTELKLQNKTLVYDLNNNSHLFLANTDNADATMLYIKNNFTQDENAILTTGINAKGKTPIQIGTSSNLKGTLNFYLLKDFYKDKITLDANTLFDTQTKNTMDQQVNFSNIHYDNTLNTSPTLKFKYDKTSNTLEVSRDYQALNKKDNGINTALNSLAQNSDPKNAKLFFMELDFAKSEQIQKALHELNANAYLDSAKISLDTQSKFNQEVFNILNKNYNDQWGNSIVAFHSNDDFKQNGDFSSYKNHNYGIKASSIKTFDNDLTLGFNLILNQNKSDIDQKQINQKTTGVYTGTYLKYNLENFYIFSGLRIGFEKNKLDRNININAFYGNYDAQFNNYITSTILGIASKYNFYHFNLEPLFYLEHSFLKYPNINENTDLLGALNVHSKNHNALNSFVGININHNNYITQNLSHQFNFMIGHKHSFIDSLKTNAHFKQASKDIFYAKNKLNQRDFLYIEGGVNLLYQNNFLIRFLLASNISKEINYNTKLEAGIKF